MTPRQRIGKAWRALSPRGVQGHAPPENFEILLSGGCVFLHFEAADNDFQQPKKDNFSKQFNHDLIPIPTTNWTFRFSFNSSAHNNLYSKSLSASEP